MGRKSLAPQRRTQILDAFERCVVDRGLAAASVGAVAREAGVDRTLVHHYFGTRDALAAAMVERLVAVYKGERDAVVALLPEHDRVPRLLDYLFGNFVHPRYDVLIDELHVDATRNPRTRELLRRVYAEFEEIVVAEVAKTCSGAPPEQVQRVGYAVICLAEGGSGLEALGFPASRRRANRATAAALIRSLVESPSL